MIDTSDSDPLRLSPLAPLHRLLRSRGTLECRFWQRPAGQRPSPRGRMPGMRSIGTWPAAPLSLRPWRTSATQMLTSRRRHRATTVASPVADTGTLDSGGARLRPASIAGGAGESGGLRRRCTDAADDPA